MKKKVALVLAVVAFFIGAQPQQSTPPKVAQMMVKVGVLRDSLTTGAVDPIVGATVVLTDEHGLVVGIKTTDQAGLTYWPIQEKRYAIFVASIGYNLQQFRHERDDGTALVLIVLKK